jgi:phage repressor protein C with HTH and peptisase S24 domain
MIIGMGIRENIRREIDIRYSGNFSRFAKEHGLSNSYLNEILNGKRRFNETWLDKISKALGMPAYQLFSDEPLVPKSEAQKYPAIIESFPHQSVHEDYGKYSSRDEFLPIRILEDAASLGHGTVVSQERTRGYALIYKHVLNKKAWTQDRKDEKILALFAQGDSMVPTIQDGSLVAIDIEDKIEIQNYKLYAIEIPDEGVTIKRVYRRGDDFMLFADNKDFPGFPRCLHMDGLNYNPTCGKVVWAWNRFD